MNKWYENARTGNLEGMKAIYKIMKNKEKEEDIKKWRDPFGVTELMKTTFWENVEIVEWLLDEVKVDVNERDGEGWSALHYAARFYNISCARVLLKHHAANLKNNSGLTPLDWAKRTGHEELENLIKIHFN